MTGAMTVTLVGTPEGRPPLVYSISPCPRCDLGGHSDLRFEKLEKQTRTVGLEGEPRMLAYWTPCPTNGQPILMSIAIPSGV